MKAFLFTIIILFIFSGFDAYSQNINDTLSITPTFKGNIYYHQNAEIKPKDIPLLMENFPEAHDLFESSREAYFFGNLFAILGTGLITLPFISSAAGYDTNWGYAFTGAGFLAITIPIFRNYHKKSEAAILLYNMKLQTPLPTRSSLKFGFSNSGVGLTMTF